MPSIDTSKLFLFNKTLIPLPNPFPTLRYPETTRIDRSTFKPDEEVLVLEAGGEVRAYPVRVAAPHHIIQDKLGDKEVLVTF